MPLLITLVILFVALVVYIKTPFGRGRLGEWRVKLALGKSKAGERYVINDYIIERDGKSSQIDHIVINKYGVFVIETKNYSGRIYGNDNQQQWIQVLNYGKVKNKLYNPVRQNATHVYRLKGALKGAPIYSVVVFVQNNTKYIESTAVIPLRLLRKYISRGTIQLTKEQIEDCYITLTENRSEMSLREHIKEIQKTKRNIENNICPRCGGRLELKEGKYGSFYGCINYPACRFTKRN